jgi:hypothetical protein
MIMDPLCNGDLQGSLVHVERMLRRVVCKKFTDVSDYLPAIRVTSIRCTDEQIRISETLVNVYPSERRNVAEENHLHTHCHENLRSHP